jgi:hypothetical protein
MNSILLIPNWVEPELTRPFVWSNQLAIYIEHGPIKHAFIQKDQVILKDFVLGYNYCF